MTAKPPKPVLKALLVCDQVIRESGTDKWSVIGVYDRLSVSKFPALIGDLSVYVRLRDAEGTYRFKLEVVRQPSGPLVPVLEGDVDVKDRARPVEWGMRTGRLLIPAAGKYDLNLVMNTELIGHTELECAVAKDGAA